MHEASLMRSLLRQVTELLEAHQGQSVEDIHVELGPLSGVEPLLIQSAFEQLAPEYRLGNARLNISQIPLEAKCAACGATFEVARFKFRCTVCGAAEIQIVRGDEFRLLSITIQQPISHEDNA